MIHLSYEGAYEQKSPEALRAIGIFICLLIKASFERIQTKNPALRAGLFFFVPRTRFELARLAAPPPQSGLSTNFNTRAYILSGTFIPNKILFKQMLRYCLPMVIIGFAGIINEMLDRALLKYLLLTTLLLKWKTVSCGSNPNQLDEANIISSVLGSSYTKSVTAISFLATFATTTSIVQGPRCCSPCAIKNSV